LFHPWEIFGIASLSAMQFGWLELFLEGEKNLRVISDAVNPRILVQLRNFLSNTFAEAAKHGNLETCCCNGDLSECELLHVRSRRIECWNFHKSAQAEISFGFDLLP
jgi:hypothetical protein